MIICLYIKATEWNTGRNAWTVVIEQILSCIPGELVIRKEFVRYAIVTAVMMEQRQEPVNYVGNFWDVRFMTSVRSMNPATLATGMFVKTAMR